MPADFLEKEAQLPNNVRTFFRSNDPTVELEKSFLLYGIDPNEVEKVSGPIGLIFVGDLRLTDLPIIISQNIQERPDRIYGLAYEINRRMFNRFPEFYRDAPALLNEWSRKKSAPLISEEEAGRKVLEIEPWLLEKKPEEEESKGAPRKTVSTVKMPLMEALKKYPQLGEQIVTSSHIKLKMFPDGVRPSVKNWLSDYTMQLGQEYHDSVARSNFLFQSENGKNLNTPDRQRLSYLLKAFDEKTPIDLNSLTYQIVFSTLPERPAAVSENRPTPVSPAPTPQTSISKPTPQPSPAFSSFSAPRPGIKKETPKNSQAPIEEKLKSFYQTPSQIRKADDFASYSRAPKLNLGLSSSQSFNIQDEKMKSAVLPRKETMDPAENPANHLETLFKNNLDKIQEKNRPYPATPDRFAPKRNFQEVPAKKETVSVSERRSFEPSSRVPQNLPASPKPAPNIIPNNREARNQSPVINLSQNQNIASANLPKAPSTEKSSSSFAVPPIKSRPQPYHISPALSLEGDPREESDDLPPNVVNLREN